MTGGSITWYLDGFIIRGGSFSDTSLRVQEEQSDNGYEFSSHLRIKKIAWQNSGELSSVNLVTLTNVT